MVKIDRLRNKMFIVFTVQYPFTGEPASVRRSPYEIVQQLMASKLSDLGNHDVGKRFLELRCVSDRTASFSIF